jgi:hypothetical protein
LDKSRNDTVRQSNVEFHRLGHCVADADDRDCVLSYTAPLHVACTHTCNRYRSPSSHPPLLALPDSLKLPIEKTPLIDCLVTSMRVYSFCINGRLVLRYLQCQSISWAQNRSIASRFSLRTKTHLHTFALSRSTMQCLLFGCDLALSVRQDLFTGADVVVA